MKQTNNFPTIHEMESAILYWMADNYGKCEYQKDSNTFLAVTYIQIPHYDSGGSVDCADFKPQVYNISFKEAYDMYVDMKKDMDEIQRQVADSIPVPVYPCCPDEDFDLPF